jgi:hypothetical protein
MDADGGPGYALKMKHYAQQFVDDQQSVKITWANIVAAVGLITRLDAEIESKAHIAWKMTIEIDENQHQGYECSCENKRIMEISRDLNHRPIVFIRFNPDEYIDKDDNKITSCWGLNKKGILTIKNNKKDEWEYRLSILKETIDYWIKHTTNKTVEVIQLFYNEN